MTPEDLQICRSIVTALTSSDRHNINYLFLEPVDPSYFPDYLAIVKRPMDLKTLGDNLEAGTYGTREEFYRDANLIFENAVAFNKGRAESVFVVGLAKKMAAAFERERKKAERRSIVAGGRSEAAGNADGGSSVSTAPPEKKKIKLSLKRNSLGDAAGRSTAGDGGKSSGAENGNDDSKKEEAPKKASKKIKLKINRGKQLPEGVNPDATTASNAPAPKSAKSAKSESPPSENLSLDQYAHIAPMTPSRRAQCHKALSGLKRRQASNCKWFLKPVNDAKLVKDYREKIEFPMDLGSISSKLDKNQYPSPAHFVLDLRRIFSNCLQYNTSVKDDFRPIVTECLAVTEDLLDYFLSGTESKSVYPSLLYCWEECVKVITTLTDVLNPDDGYQTAYYFLHRVQFFCEGEFPANYLERVKAPMDLGSIVQKLLTGEYGALQGFVSDCRLVIENCKAYYVEVDDESKFMLARANRLKEAMDPLLEKLVKYDQSAKGAAAREKAAKGMTIKKPEKRFLKEIMAELRGMEYTDRQTKLTEKATTHFEKPVDTTHFPDYRNYVETPMDLETVDGKIEKDAYTTPEDFEYDISLIFKNCDRYNTPKNNLHMLALGKYTAKAFKKLFSSKMRSLERGGSVAKHPVLPTAANRETSVGSKVMSGKKRPLSPTQDEKPSKRVSIKVPSLTASKSVPKGGKLAGKLAGGKKAARQSAKKIAATSKLKIDLNAPVPMHVAIASIKESYLGRRQPKDLEDWEVECLKFHKQLTKHPWISAERPKYIFHVPVDIIFPEIREAYNAKIENPMDLTTAEMKLLQGAYRNADEFVADIALIFSNALTFNREGYEMGEAMSCAYYEASTHLLKYSRWLSLEVLQSYLVDSAGSAVVHGCAAEWDLTLQNREVARKEMEDIVFNEHLDKTEAGDKLSWSETECEKLLKSLKHTSDLKHMTFFIETSFPADYTAIISKPIAWITCHEKLKNKKYDTIGQIVADLRLIFSNALKYNDRVRSHNKVSQMAYDSANHMSNKLEQAIDKMLLSVSDRIGREKIDMITLHREVEAKERAEEEQLKAQWEKDNPSTAVEVKTKFRIQRTHRKRTDFEFPFDDEEDDNEESHDDTIRNAKTIFERQQKERAKMKAISLSIGMHVFEGLRQRAHARAWACRMAYKLHVQQKLAEEKLNASKESSKDVVSTTREGDCVLTALSAESRTHVKISLSKPLPKKAKRKVGLSAL